VLRSEEEKIAFVRYAIENPLRAELVESPLDYPFCGFVDVLAGGTAGLPENRPCR